MNVSVYHDNGIYLTVQNGVEGKRGQERAREGKEDGGQGGRRARRTEGKEDGGSNE